MKMKLLSAWLPSPNEEKSLDYCIKLKKRKVKSGACKMKPQIEDFKPDQVNQYINKIKYLNNTIKEEEEEKVSPSDLVSVLISKDITLDNALKFETRLIEKGLKGLHS